MDKVFLPNLHDKENKNWQTSQKYFQCSVLGIMDIIQKEPSLENLITLTTVLCRACHRLPAAKIEPIYIIFKLDRVATLVTDLPRGNSAPLQNSPMHQTQ